MYAVRSTHELKTYVIPFFGRYPLRGRKRKNFELWREAVHLISRGEHHSPAGLARIVDLKEKLNTYSDPKTGTDTERIIREMAERYETD